MKELRREVEKLEKKELTRALATHERFASDHEGVSVIDEEVWEADIERRRVRQQFNAVREFVYEDNPKLARVEAKELMRVAILAACEFIQVAAMAEKFCLGDESEEEKPSVRNFSWEVPSYLKGAKVFVGTLNEKEKK